MTRGQCKKRAGSNSELASENPHLHTRLFTSSLGTPKLIEINVRFGWLLFGHPNCLGLFDRRPLDWRQCLESGKTTYLSNLHI
jgi:hypothetical protein